MTTPLTITPDRDPDGTHRLTVAGEVDLSNAHTLAAALDGTTGPVLLDLTAVDYLDSVGLQILFDHVERIRLRANPILAPVLTISGLTTLTSVDIG